MKQLEVSFDNEIRDVVINGAVCDYCGRKTNIEFSAFYDQAICEACLEHFE